MMARFTCRRCRTRVEAKTEKLPRGWKRAEDSKTKTTCGKCWNASYALRAVVIPVAGPVVEGVQSPAALEAGWESLREKLHVAWSACTRVANWAVRELAKAEPPREPGQAKLGKATPLYLYPGARELAPELATTSTTSLLRAAERKYAERRYHAIWRCAESLPSYRYPTPLPIHVDSWSLVPLEGGAIGVSVPFGAGDTLDRTVLRLRGGHGFARQRAALEALQKGEARKCELAIYEQRGHRSDHRPGVVEREAGGAPRGQSRVVVKVVLWMPVKERVVEGTMYVRTSRDCLLTWSFGEGKGDEAAQAYRYNADHVRRWVAEHDVRLARTSDDLKHEKRWPKKVRDAQIAARAPWVEKFNRRLDSLTHEASAMIARMAERRRVARVVYDDSERGYVDHFRWDDLKTKIAYKLKALGVAFEESTAASGEPVTTVVTSLAVNGNDGRVEGSAPSGPPLGLARRRRNRRAHPTARGTLHKN